MVQMQTTPQQHTQASKKAHTTGSGVSHCPVTTARRVCDSDVMPVKACARSMSLQHEVQLMDLGP